MNIMSTNSYTIVCMYVCVCVLGLAMVSPFSSCHLPSNSISLFVYGLFEWCANVMVTPFLLPMANYFPCLAGHSVFCVSQGKLEFLMRIFRIISGGPFAFQIATNELWRKNQTNIAKRNYVASDCRWKNCFKRVLNSPSQQLVRIKTVSICMYIFLDLIRNMNWDII